MVPEDWSSDPTTWSSYRVAPDLELDWVDYRTYSPTTPPPFAAKGQANDVFSRQLYCL